LKPDASSPVLLRGALRPGALEKFARMTMNMTDLVPWDRRRAPVTDESRRNVELDPWWAFHREVNRLFGAAFHGFFFGFDIALFGFGRGMGGPEIEVAETDHEVLVTAELPGFDAKEVNVELTNNVLTITGEKKSAKQDRDRLFSEYYYDRFERRIPLDCDIAEDQVAASFRNGILTVTLPKPAVAQERTRRIPINGG
jgi:HSP20 family protein